MLQGTIDLHIHTSCSDGLDTPEEIVETAIRNGYKVISITDHDTMEGVVRGKEAARGTSLELIPGIELSAMNSDEIHILGYYIDYHDSEFIKHIAFFKEKRWERAKEMVECLNRLGLDITIESVLKISHGAPIGRPHIAEALLAENLIDSFNEAFTLYIGMDRPAYVPKYRLTPCEAIEIILKNGGIPVIAHPAVIHRDDIIPELIECGLMGIEAIHPLHTKGKQHYYKKLADKYGLIATGGSDWHGRSRRRNYHNICEGYKVSEKTIIEMKLIVNSRKKNGGERIASES